MKRGTGKRLIAVLLTLSILMTLLPVSALGAGRGGFRDVSDGDWFSDAVDYVVSHGIFNGTSDSTFEPDGGMTRAMMVTVLGRVALIDEDDYSGASGFTDVERGSWYEPYVSWAVESGITLGVGEGLFAPNDPVTRAQMALFLYRLLQYLDVDAPEAVTDGLPADYDDVPDYAREAVELMWKCGVFEGGGDNRFDPARQLTRAEVATLLMRVDGHLVDEGFKEYTDEPEDDDDDRPVVTPPVTPDDDDDDGDEPGGDEGSVLYEPKVDETPGTAAKLDVDTGFSITVKSSEAMTLEKVKAAITAVDTSDPTNTNVISVKDNDDGTYTITGLKPSYTDEGKTTTASGFAPGHAYKITLNNDALTFAGEKESVREYNFTVAREESLNVELRDDIVYIPASDVSGGIDAGLLEVGENGIENAGEEIKGSFTLNSASTLSRAGGAPKVGDIVAVYEGTPPEERTANSESEDNTAPISYVRITQIDSDGTYHYEGVETADVLDMPEIFPVSIYDDTDGDFEKEDKSATIPAKAFDYAGGFFSEARLDADAEVKAGDYIAFYTGYLNTAADTEDDLADSSAELAYYARIDKLTESGDAYIIEYTEVTLDDIITEQSSYTSQEMDMSQLLSDDDVSELEASIEQEVKESGMAEEVAQAVVNMALTGESLDVLREELGLTELNVSQSGSSSSGPAALSASGTASSSDITVQIKGANADVDTSSARYGGKGLTVKLTIEFTVKMGQNLNLDFVISLEQQLKIVLDAGVDTVCEWLWGFIPYPDWIVTASIDVYSYTGLDIDMNARTDDGVTEVTDYVDMIKDLLEEGGDESTAETLASLYKETLENDSDWVDLFKYRLMHEKKTLAKIVNFSMELSFVVSGKVNVYVGVNFDYEIARRYIFTMQLLKSRTSNDTISLIPEQYELEVYVLGMLGLRAGLRIELAASLIHKKVAGVGVSAEAGAYIELYGYFAYTLKYIETTGRQSQAAGNMFVEIGIYVEVGAEVEAIGGLITWMPTILSLRFPLWTAGNQFSVLGFHEPAGGIGTLEFGYSDAYNVPSSVFTMDVMDMKTGKVTPTNYANAVNGQYFKVENTNDEIKDGWLKTLGSGFLAIPLPFWQYQLQAAHDINDMNRYETGQLIITYEDPTSKLAFNTEPIQRVVDYSWDQVGDHGFNLVLSSEAEPYQIAFYDFEGKEVEYDLSDFDRYGYKRLGWLDMNGNYSSEEEAYANLISDDELPRAIQGENCYYVAVWEKIDVPYKVRHHYQNPDGSYPSNDEAVVTDHTDGRVEVVITPSAAEGFTSAVQAKPGYGTPFTRSITVITGPGEVVADFYYPLESYTATVNYTVGSKTVKTVEYTLKYGQTIPTPSMDGYTLSGWTNPTMAAGNTTYTATFTANTETPYVVEHYLQQPDGSYVLAENGRIEKEGTTGGTVDVSGFTAPETGYNAGTYDTTLTIAGDGSTVVKVRYALSALHTATFYDTDKTTVIGKSYYYADKTIPIPQSVNKAKPGYTPIWDEDTSFSPAPNDDIKIYVSGWAEGEGTAYTVKHLEEDPDNPGEYILVQTDNLTGTTNGPATVTLIQHKEGEFEEGVYKEATISGNGTTVVEVKYDRCEYTLTYNLNAAGASFVEGVEAKVTLLFGATLDLPDSADATLADHALTGWTTDPEGKNDFTGTTMPANHLTLYAKWEEGIPYTVTNRLLPNVLWESNYSDGSPEISYRDYDSDYYVEVVEYRVAPEAGEIKVEPTVREHYVTPESQTITISADGTVSQEVEFRYTPTTYNFTLYDTDGSQVYSGSARYGTDLTQIQFKFGYRPAALYTDSACTQEYNPNIEDTTVDLYVKEWVGVTYRVTVDLGTYHTYEEYGNFWELLEAQDVEITEGSATYSVVLSIQYGSGAKLPEASELEIGMKVDLKQYYYDSELGGSVFKDIDGFTNGAFDSLFTGNLSIGNSYRFVKDRGGTTGENGTLRKIYTVGDLKEIEIDIILGYRNFELVDNIKFEPIEEGGHGSISNISDWGSILLEGNNHTISGYRSDSGQGLFYDLPHNTVIRNLTLSDFKITAVDDGITDEGIDRVDNVGLLVREVKKYLGSYGQYEPGDITLENVHLEDSSLDYGYVENWDGGLHYIGGLIGTCGNALLTGCSIGDDVTLIDNDSGITGIGAFIGCASGERVQLTSCTNGLTDIPDVYRKDNATT